MHTRTPAVNFAVFLGVLLLEAGCSGSDASNSQPGAKLVSGTGDGAGTATKDTDGSDTAADSSAPDAKPPNPCTSPAECGSGVCVDGKCAECAYGLDCKTQPAQCIAGACVAQTPCTTDKNCGNAGQVCNPESQLCVECVSGADCPVGMACKAHKCLAPGALCKSSKECAPSGVCDKVSGTCVECAATADCPKGLACAETVCVPLLCEPNAATCTSPQALKQCASDGMSTKETTCEPATTCSQGACVPLVCKPGEKSCDGASVVTCDASGLSLATVACPDGDVCVGGACLPAVCSPGETQCQDGALATCTSDGTSWTAKACANGQACAGDQCLPKVCLPDSLSCSGSKITQCDATGTSAAVQTDCSQAGKICLDGACVKPDCTPGAIVCMDKANLGTCKSSGLGYDATPCGSGKVCGNGACQSVVCAAGTKTCVGQTVTTCNALGTGTTTTFDCAQAGQSCVQGKCVAVTCTPNQVTCQGQQLAVCNAAGTGVTLGQDCAATGQACVNGACVGCLAGAKECDGAALKTCKSDGSGWSVASCDDGEACTDDSCAQAACTHAPKADGAACDDGTACTTADACKGGKCTGKDSLWTLTVPHPVPTKSQYLSAIAPAGGASDGWIAAGETNDGKCPATRVLADGTLGWLTLLDHPGSRVAATSGGYAVAAGSYLIQLDKAGAVVNTWSDSGVSFSIMELVVLAGLPVVCGPASGIGAKCRQIGLDGKEIKSVVIKTSGGTFGGACLTGPTEAAVISDYTLGWFDSQLQLKSTTPSDGWPKAGIVCEPKGLDSFSDGSLALLARQGSSTTLLRVGPSGKVLWQTFLKWKDSTDDQLPNRAVVLPDGSIEVLARFTGSDDVAVRWNINPDGSVRSGHVEPITAWNPKGMVADAGTVIVAAATGQSPQKGVIRRSDHWGNGTCAASGPCFSMQMSACDDANPCTNDLCDAAHNGCYHEPFPEGMPCAPGKKCNNGLCAN